MYHGPLKTKPHKHMFGNMLALVTNNALFCRMADIKMPLYHHFPEIHGNKLGIRI